MISSTILNQIAGILDDKDPEIVLFFLEELERIASPQIIKSIERTSRELDEEERHTDKVLSKDASPRSQEILDDKKKRCGKKSLTKGRPRNWAEEITVLNVVSLYRDCFSPPKKSHADPCLKILHLLFSTFRDEAPWHSFLKAIEDLTPIGG